MEMKDDFVNKMTDISLFCTMDKQSPVVCKALSCRLFKECCSVSKLYHDLYRLQDQHACEKCYYTVAQN